VSRARTILQVAGVVVASLGIGAIPAGAQTGDAQSCAEKLTEQLRRFSQKCVSDVVTFVASQPKMGADAAVTVRGVWLHSVFIPARDEGVLERARYADLVLKLAWRRHGHQALEAVTLLDVLKADQTLDFANFRAVTRFIGTENADIGSHLGVVSALLEHLWRTEDVPQLMAKPHLGFLLEQLCRFREDWALTLAFLKAGAPGSLRDCWSLGGGSFPAGADLQTADAQVASFRTQLRMRALARECRRSLFSTRWPLR
jgi:hypothetical protein